MLTGCFLFSLIVEDTIGKVVQASQDKEYPHWNREFSIWHAEVFQTFLAVQGLN